MWFIHTPRTQRTLRTDKRHIKIKTVNTKPTNQQKKHKIQITPKIKLTQKQHKNKYKNITPNTSLNTSHPAQSDIIDTYKTTMKQLRSNHQSPKPKSKAMSLQQNIESHRIAHVQTSASISTNQIIRAQHGSLQINQPTKNHIK